MEIYFYRWIEACINEELPEAGELEEKLRNGVYLAKLGHFFAPDTVPQRRIYDADLSRYKTLGLTFRHTDNINYFLKALKKIKLPSVSAKRFFFSFIVPVDYFHN